MNEDKNNVIQLKKRSLKQKASERFLESIGDQVEPEALASGGKMDDVSSECESIDDQETE
ncbi:MULTISPECIES: hypothetical protein [unclassified Vibrio]|uniref:hypothetical protein n=1 Tax=unclassified Vibrio TaxID=2614977 RepID=UPI0025556331|nr:MULTISPECIES: hypothetical protein [unclassified Vibrio]MDK9777440.1 hypothetical protein [Vibrio sp. D401a]MDK9809269.1 hypothetical protein [Vibrio sp. D406a]